MKKNIFLINLLLFLFSLFTLSSLAAQEEDAKMPLPGTSSRQFSKNKDWDILEARLDFLTGYRRDKLDWSIAGDLNGENPNILSELSWKDLQIFQIKTDGSLLVDKQFRLEYSYGYGWINEGKNQDSDYLGNNRTFEFSRSNNSSDGDNVSDWSLGLGYQFNLGKLDYLSCDNLTFAVLGGYSHHEQNLRMTNGFQTIPATGAFDGLNSTYQAEWKGPWLGAEIEGPSGKITTLLRIEYHWADYYAEADWNLRPDFSHPVSYTHTADGKGIIGTFGIGYKIQEDWLLYFRVDVNDWKTKAGIDRTFFSDGSSSDTQLNRVNWRSSAFMIGLKCRL